LNVADSASASWSTPDEAARVQIQKPGATASSIQLVQRDLTLVRGRDYLLEFTASADQPRYIELKFAQTDFPYAVYWVNRSCFLTPARSRYSYRLTMRDATDPEVGLMFNLGGSPWATGLDEVTLKLVDAADSDASGHVDFQDLKAWSGKWLRVGEGSDLTGDGRVDFQDLNSFGESWPGESVRGQQQQTPGEQDHL
jgi:hypothetical protein